MRLETRTLLFVGPIRIPGQARHGRARRSGAGIVGPRERRRRGSAGAKPPGSSEEHIEREDTYGMVAVRRRCRAVLGHLWFDARRRPDAAAQPAEGVALRG